MMDIEITTAVRSKLWHKHGATFSEIWECFANRRRGALIDDRVQHRPQPPILWFIAATSKRRVLKVVFQIRDGRSHIITVLMRIRKKFAFMKEMRGASYERWKNH